MSQLVSAAGNIPIVASRLSTLRAIGRDEYWLQDSITRDPSLLGLGPVAIKAKELRQHSNRGGRLDILAYDAALDTYYEIEVMLGECDADHGFRTLDYWARERLRTPNARHIAVLVAENLSGRYSTVIETLPQYVPLIAVEIRTLVLSHDPPIATTFPVIVSQPDDLILRPADEPDIKDDVVAAHDEASWLTERPEFTKFARDMHHLSNEKIGPSSIDFTAKSYIALKKGRRAWLPMWPRKEGAYVYIPGGPGGTADQPSDFFARVQAELAGLGIEPSWTFKYNAGANPIAFPISSANLSHSNSGNSPGSIRIRVIQIS